MADSDHNLKIAGIVGLAIGVVLAACVLCWIRHSNKRDDEKSNKREDEKSNKREDKKRQLVAPLV